MAKPHFQRQRVPIEGIVFDAGTQIRVSINENVVTDYAEQMTEGVEFPPIVLFHDGVRYYLADGFHRTLAAKRNQFRDIEADVEVGTRADALWFALGANRTNGQRLNERDVRHALELAFKAWGDRSAKHIADQIGCSSSYASKVREQLQRSTTATLPDRVVRRDGKSQPATPSSGSGSVAAGARRWIGYWRWRNCGGR